MVQKKPDEAMGFFAVVEGRVQGVGFRYSVFHLARQLGLNGWVKNTMNGAVELFAEGRTENIEKLAVWLKKGPPGAKVENIRIDRVEYSGQYDSFTIVR
jgi:acylphosphatase